MTHALGSHAPRFGVNSIHEPVLSGALAGAAETLLIYPNDPSFMPPIRRNFSSAIDVRRSRPRPPASLPVHSGGEWRVHAKCAAAWIVRRGPWRITPRLTLNYGVRYDTTFGLFTAGATAARDPSLLTLQALQIPLVGGAPHDYRKAFAPRLGIAYSPGQPGNTVCRAGFGLFFNDLAQNGWVTALQAVVTPLASPARRRVIQDAFRGAATAH